MRHLYTTVFGKKLLLSFSLVLFLTNLLNAQLDIAIGTGTVTNTNITYPCPLQDRYEGSRAQYLIRASELTAAGMAAGNISGIKFNVTSLGSGTTAVGIIENYTIKIGHTTKASLDATVWEPSPTIVVNPVNYQPVMGTNSFTFISPFGWNGSDNLLIEICNGGSTAGTTFTYNATVPWTTGLSFNANHTYRADNVDNTCTTTTLTQTGDLATRPNMVLVWSPAAACTTPPTAGTALVTPAVTCAGGAISLSLTGSSFGNGQTYQWETSSSATGPFTPVGTAQAGWSYNTTAPLGDNYFRCAVTCSGNTQYSNPVLVTGRGPLAGGTYTINSSATTTGTNFQSFADAISALICGVGGPVVFNVLPGTTGVYNEQVIINNLLGVSAINTVTFNGNGNTLSYASSNTLERAVVKLNDADYITFNNLIISGSGGTYGYGVQLLNNADNNTFRGCTLNIDAASTSTFFAGVVINAITDGATTTGATLCDNNTFDNNTINGGYYGVTLIGSSAALLQGNKFTNNTIKDYYSYGIYLSYSDGGLFENNLFARPTRPVVSSYYGIYFTAGGVNNVISKNRFTNGFGGNNASVSTFYGIYVTAVDATSASVSNKVINNLVYNTTGSGDVYGFYNSSSDNIVYYHNTVSIDGTPTSSTTSDIIRCFYQTGAATGIDVRNNLFYISRNSAAIKNCIYLATTTSTITSNYNNLINASTTGTNYTGTYGTATQVTLTDWRTASGKDANSIAVLPEFLDVNTGNLAPNNPAMDNLGTSVSILTDINGNSRSTTTPDIGAYEFSPVPCTNPPVPGTVTTTQTPVCLGQSFTLGFTGGSFGAGQTYQWQVSIDNGTTWNDIAGATATTLTRTQGITSQYRIVFTCGGTSVPSAALQVVTPLLASGVYTINSAGGGDFTSFNAAYNFLKCGINGPITFNVVSNAATYNEQLIMTPVPGASAVNTITFNGNGNTISYLSTATDERAVIKLNGTDFVRFDSLNIKATASTSSEYGWGVQLINSADSNYFTRCVITVDTANTSTQYAGIVISGSATSAITTSSQCDGNIFERNTINGGYYGMTLIGTSTLYASYNRIKGNTFTNFYRYGIYVEGSFDVLVDSNTVKRPERSNIGAFTGIYFTTISAKANVTRNTITNPFGGNTTSTALFGGIHFNACDPLPAVKNIVSNNLIYNINGGGDITGLHDASSDNVSFLHNTVSIDGTGAASTATNTSRGFYQVTLAAGIDFRNNIITINRGGPSIKHAIYLGTSTSEIVSDKNDFYINSSSTNSNIGNSGANDFAILANWQQATNLDLNSVSNDPLYENASAGNFKPSNVSINNIGDPVNIAIDILGQPRTLATPDPGAYEFTPPACIVPPTPGNTTLSANPVCENSLVMLGLTGHTTGFGQTYVWQVSANAAGPFADISGPLSNPSFTITATNTLYYRAAVTCGGNTVYSTPLILNVTPGLPGGNYTIDATQPASPTNFISFNAAKDAMACGITGPVVIDVVPGTGPYLEQVIFDSIPGTSSNNTVTFNGNANVIKFGSANTNERAVIKLYGTDYFIFDSLTVDATGGTYGFGFQLMNNADSNTIRNCTIIGVDNSTSSNYAGIVISASATSATGTGATLSDHNTIDNNTVTGGYYGITSVGGTTQQLISNKITRNKIREFYTYGIYTGNNTGGVIEHNDIQRPTRAAVSTYYGIYVTGPSYSNLINGNKIHSPFGGAPTSTSSAYGMYFTAVDALTGQENKVTNNAIYDFNGTNIQYGIYNSSSSFIKYYHNTISLDHQATASTSTTRGFYQITDAEGIELRNNIITVTRAGTGVKHAYYFATDASLSQAQSNNNDLFVAGSNAYIGYEGTNRTTLTDWQTASTKDANSVNIDPVYTSVTDLTPTIAILDNKGVPMGVLNDINSIVRSVTTPDLGAYEFAITPCTTPPVAGVSTANPSSGICLGSNITLNLTGNSVGGFQTYRWQRGSSVTGPWEDISGELNIPLFQHTLTSSNSWFRAAVTCSGNTVYSTPVQVVLNPLLLAGDYTIDPAQPASTTNYQSFASAVAILDCGITGSVRFHVAAGTYSEQVRMRRVPGTSPTVTVTFMSASGDPASVNLTHASTVAANNYTLKLDSTNYIIYKNMTITASNTSNGRAVELAGTSTGDSILNCRIVVPVTTSTSTAVAGIYAMDLSGSNNVIKDNIVSNGSSGIYLSGTTNVSKNITVENNTINGAYYYGIYAANLFRSTFNRNTISRTGVINSTSYGMYLSNCDTAYQVNNNRVEISGTGAVVYGIYLTGCQSSQLEKGRVSNNKVIAGSGNTGTQYGLYVTTSTNNNSVNNVIIVNTTGATAYGIYSTGTGGISYYNNSVQNASTGATPNTNVAAYFSQTSGSEGAVNIRNNIFSNTGSGKAMYIANPNFIYSDYNMYHTNGATLIQWGTNLNYATLKAWRDTSYWDYNSIVYQPAYASGSELMPDLASPNVWAMHGRGVQIEGNNRDFNNASRPVTLTEGVPDLGAYEFLPTSIPVALTAFPAAPAPNTTQVFMLGTDTVTKVSWGATVPTTITGKRYSGIMPPNLGTGQSYMYFYTDFDITGSTPTGHTVKQFYLDPWLGFISTEQVLKLGRTNAANTWDVSTNSSVAIYENILTESNLAIVDKYTGLTDGNAISLPPVTVSPSDSSNMGRQFWVGYGHHQDFGAGNAQNMVLYLGAGATPATATVRINGTSWSKTYSIPANTVIASDFMPKYGIFDARLTSEGLSQKGISIESNVPITAYAHIYGNTNSGATMLMPIGTYGFEYYGLTAKQNYASNTYSWVNVIAAYDSTVVEITPSQPTLGGRPAGVPFTVQLKRGEVYQVLGAIISGSDGYDLTGTKIKSISNQNGKCYPVAMFSGSSRTNIGCNNTTPASSGDNIIQQSFPYRAWGRRYLTAPTSASTGANVMQTNIYKVAVKDPTTVVKLNGVQLTNLINNLYYQFETNAAAYVESDKPVMMAQFITSEVGNTACGNVGSGDPEMIYLSPVEQGIKSVALYRNTEYNITTQYLTLIIPESGLSSLRIDGTSTFDFVYDHPNLTGYKVVVKRWTAANAQTFVSSDIPFTAITYGLGGAESYGYNAGTLVKNLNVFPGINNVFNTLAVPNEYTCDSTPFKITFLSTVQPQVIEWKLSAIPVLSPNNDVIQNNPTPESTTVINGVTYYRYTLPLQYVIHATGTFNVPIFITHPDVEGCNNRMESSIPITVVGAPVVNFNNGVTICPGSPFLFNGTAGTYNNTPVANWNWIFGDNGTATIQNPTHTYVDSGTYNVKLSIISAEGCVGDTIKPVRVEFGPAVVVVPDSVGACLNDNVTFTIQNPNVNATYTWYSAATGGTVVTTGTSYTVNNVTAPATFYIESSLNGCLGGTRKKVQITVRASLVTPVVIVDSAGSNLVKFRWNAVPNATAYEVTIDGGTTWITPSSGALGLTHTVTGLAVGQTVTLRVRALGGCLPVISAAVTGQAVTDQVYIPNTFTPNNDGMNDQLRVYSNVIRSMRFMIFNQWGEKIYEANGVSASWDGMYKNKSQPSGVYMYVADIILVDGTRIQRKGSVNLVR